MSLKIGILTVSDRASAGTYKDLSGPEIQKFLSETINSKWSQVCLLVPDEKNKIEPALLLLADTKKCDLIITTGGTGPAPRDVTPEATFSVCDRMLPGFGEKMRADSLLFTPTAILSRQEAGLRGHTLIINLPGKPEAIRPCLNSIFPAIPKCISLVGGPEIFIKVKQ